MKNRNAFTETPSDAIDGAKLAHSESRDQDAKPSVDACVSVSRIGCVELVAASHPLDPSVIFDVVEER
jgi:hypothetical protein